MCLVPPPSPIEPLITEHVVSMAASLKKKKQTAVNLRDAGCYKHDECYLKFCLQNNHVRTLHFVST